MADVTDLFASVYDTLARTFSVGSLPGSYFQFGWPGISLSPADFKLSDGPGAPYDANAAEETFSLLCNIAPTCNPVRFENSGFEIDDLYQIILLGAVPWGADPQKLLAFPSYKLFSDAQYEMAQAQKGSNRDPSVTYYACRATPLDWYTEASAEHWTTFSLNSGQIQPPALDSPSCVSGASSSSTKALPSLSLPPRTWGRSSSFCGTRCPRTWTQRPSGALLAPS